MKNLSPAEIGIYIIDGQDDECEQFGFVSQQEFQDFVKENVVEDSNFIIYNYDKNGVLNVINCGTREDLNNL